jgi:hypothetical protein
MTKTLPTLTLDSLATATICFYILSSPTNDMRAAFAEYDDDTLTDITIDELNENELLFDIFIDADTNIDHITDAEFHYRDEFRAIIKNAYANHRKFLNSIS